MKLIITMLYFFVLFWHPLHALEPTSLDIFDATADWGTGGKAGGMIGEFMVPGFVEVSRDENGATIYDVYGKGYNIGGESDEGFYLYTEREGSWSISAKIRILNNDDEKPIWRKALQMILKKSNHLDRNIIV